MGLDAHLTLANRKGVDIVVLRESGDAVTVEVKGLAGKYEWPAGNLGIQHPDPHFVVLVSFEGLIGEAEMPPPRAWMVSFPEVQRFQRYCKTCTNVARSAIINHGGEFENAWG